MHHDPSTGVPIWVAIVVPLVTALLGLLGGGWVRFLLDRRADVARAVGYARVVRLELLQAARRLQSDNLHLLSTIAWEQYSSDLAGAVLEHEFMMLNTVYSSMALLNPRMQAIVAPIPTAAPFPATVDDETRRERGTTALLVAQGLAAIEWLARGDVRLLRQRRMREMLTPDPAERCRCGHRWVHHRWQWKRRRALRLRWRRYDGRSIAHECNVEGCRCAWFREPGAIHLPRWFQRRLGFGIQARPLGHDDAETEPQIDPSIQPTAQPGAVVPADEASASGLDDQKSRSAE